MMLTVQSWLKQLGLATLLLSLASGVCVAAPSASVSGVVRDGQGVVQIGAMVQVLAADSSSIATAFTDIYGRYRILNLLPGKYQIRASAPLFLPTTRGNLHLLTGARATVNLTLTTLVNPTLYLPAERRKPTEPDDDWTWTQRAAANRSILRMMGDGDAVLVSEAPEASPINRLSARATLTGGEGGFGEGRLHTVVALDRASGGGPVGGSDIVLRADIAPAAIPGAGVSLGAAAPALELDAGYERSVALGRASRVVVSYESHPELVTSSAQGMQVMRIATAQKMGLGDAVDVEAGGTVYAIHTDQTPGTIQTSGYALGSQPFLRVTVHPGEVWAVRYRLATSRDVLGFDGLDSIHAAPLATAAIDGRLRTAAGLHQEIALSRKLRRFGDGMVEASIYSDTIAQSQIAGFGQLTPADLLPASASTAVVADTTTGSFQLLSARYTTRGVSLMVADQLNPLLLAELQYQAGSALAVQNFGVQSSAALSLGQLAAQLRAQTAQVLTAALQGQMVRTGTRLRAAYRYQPTRLLTPVASYQAFSDQAFLSCSVRQALRWGDRLPPGLEARVDVTNLLAQGYQPFLSADGRTLFLAQSPRTLQAGLSFSF
jgi:hypothetical protein